MEQHGMAQTIPTAPLLAWYDATRRPLPWRRTRDPYRIWLSEIMCQQTAVATAEPYYERFTARWPSVEALAAAELDDVLREWQGLGYYARARNLHRCAQAVAGDFGGVFPDSEEGLRGLPGIGPYTAAAIAAIAFERKTAPVDGNIKRVLSRWHAEPDLGRIDGLARAAAPDSRPGDFWQAVMELGALVCSPRRPDCLLCPIAVGCRARAEGAAEDYPPRRRRGPIPTRHGVAFVLTDASGAVLLRRRPESGLLGGMMEFPSTEWRDRPWTLEEALRFAPAPSGWRVVDGAVTHVFSHFRLEMTVAVAVIDTRPEGIWCGTEGLAEQALPTLMRKIAERAYES